MIVVHRIELRAPLDHVECLEAELAEMRAQRDELLRACKILLALTYPDVCKRLLCEGGGS